MIAIARGIAALRELFDGDLRDLSRIVLNSPSQAEVGLALGLLAREQAERDLVSLVNLREVLAELPRTPMPMAVDFATLSGVAGFERNGMVWQRRCEDPHGDYDLIVLGEGNMCYDLVVAADGESVFWTQHGEEPPLIHPKALELVVSRDTLLDSVVKLAIAMGLPFNPTFYLSLEDFRLEYAEDSMDDLLNGLF